jgi:serine/threonine protein kinase
VHNPDIDREVYLLNLLRTTALEIEEQYQAQHPGQGALNYRLGFPKVIDSFQVSETDIRKAMVLDFSGITDVLSELVPLKFITTRDKMRVDPRTSAWILGKFLKVLSFIHDQNVLQNRLVASNLLINRKEHLVTIFDWSMAQFSETRVVGSALAQLEIVQVAECIQKILGADSETGKLPEHEDLHDTQYEDMLRKLAGGEYNDAYHAHEDFYKLIRAIWPKSYHPFTCYPLIG